MNVYDIAKASKITFGADSNLVDRAIDKVMILECRPASDALNFTTKKGETFSRSNITFRYVEGELAGKVCQTLFPEAWIVMNNAKSITGAVAMITQTVRKSAKDSAKRIADPLHKAGVGAGDEVLGTSHIEIITSAEHATLASLGAIFTTDSKN